MKKIFIGYYAAFALCMAGCEQNEIMLYESESCIYFDYPRVNMIYKNVEVDSMILSFGMAPEEQLKDTAYFRVKCMGRISDRDRTYHVSIVDSLTTMVEGVDFEEIPRIQVFRPGSYVDSIRLVVSREHLNPNFAMQESKRLVLRIEKGGDLGIGRPERRELKLSVNNYLSQPIWWEQDEYFKYLKYYHPEKWRVLIYFDSRAANSEKMELNSLEVLNLCTKKAAPYLEKNPVYDDDTHERILWDRKVAGNN